MNFKSLVSYYKKHYASLTTDPKAVTEAERLVGGDFKAVGALEYYLLKAQGLKPESVLVDIGCGTGRLAYQLARRGHQSYCGFDIVESAIEHARSLCEKPDWKFGLTDGLHVDLPDQCADMVCFFSVFTHIANEHSYLYLKEASRLLKPGGKIVFSFLEFRIYSHWAQFEIAYRQFGTDQEPIVFLDRDGITHFARELELEIAGYLDGDKANVPIEEEIAWANGAPMKDAAFLGQSACILRKP
jgi:SAM-dependent methyltransferase